MLALEGFYLDTGAGVEALFGRGAWPALEWLHVGAPAGGATAAGVATLARAWRAAPLLARRPGAGVRGGRTAAPAAAGAASSAPPAGAGASGAPRERCAESAGGAPARGAEPRSEAPASGRGGPGAASVSTGVQRWVLAV